MNDESSTDTYEERRKAFIAARDKTHMEQVERWANFVKTHPRSVWKKEVGPFIDAQVIMANRFYERLAKTPGGMEKIRKLREMRNQRMG